MARTLNFTHCTVTIQEPYHEVVENTYYPYDTYVDYDYYRFDYSITKTAALDTDAGDDVDIQITYRDTWYSGTKNYTFAEETVNSASTITGYFNVSCGEDDEPDGMEYASSYTIYVLTRPSTGTGETKTATFSGFNYYAPTPPTKFTLPSQIVRGANNTISWSGATDADGNSTLKYRLDYGYATSSSGSISNWTTLSSNITGTSYSFKCPTNAYKVQFEIWSTDGLGQSDDSLTSSTVSTVAWNSPTVPSSINVPSTVKSPNSVTVTWGTSTDADGDLTGYTLERATNSGYTNWSQVYKGSNTSFTENVSTSWNYLKYRVKAYDSYSFISGYTTSEAITVTHNQAPVITNSNGDLGTFSVDPPTYQYSVSDVDTEDTITVTEYYDSTKLRSFTATPSQNYTVTVPNDMWVTSLNGSHTIKVTASDGKKSATRTMTLTKNVTSLSATFANPLPADAAVSVAIATLVAELPFGTTTKVEVCNNAYDESPTWEDVTASALEGKKFALSNTQKTAELWGYNIRVTISRGSATGDVWFKGLSGYYG